MGILIGILGVLLSAVGVLTFIAGAMPTYGGSRNDTTSAFVFGIAMFLGGIALVFYGGTWL
jgi:hypothetical protein